MTEPLSPLKQAMADIQSELRAQVLEPASCSPSDVPAPSMPEVTKSVPRFEKGKYEIDWISTTVIFLPPLLIAGAIYAGVPFQWKTVVLAVLFYFMTGLGITVGYHRLFSHRAFSANAFLQWVLLIWGAGAFQGSAKWWCRNHRIHHRYVDTDKDPYNAKRGFFYTHIGWMLLKQDYSLLGRVDVSDFRTNHAMQLQHQYYLPIALSCALVAPTLIAGLGWGDWLGGYFYAGLLKMVFTHHCTFFINSLAHTQLFGAAQNFSDQHTSADSPIFALLSLGEGYHNFHHEFAHDYRNGIKWYHYDPSKWFIRSCEVLGWAFNLVRVPNEVIERNMCELSFKKHAAAVADAAQKIKASERQVGLTAPTRTTMTWVDFEKEVAQGRKLMVVGSYVLDLTKVISTGAGYTHKSSQVVWYDAHPGGRKMLDMFIGKDATEAITGGVYAHHEGALNLIHHLRIAHIERDLKAE